MSTLRQQHSEFNAAHASPTNKTIYMVGVGAMIIGLLMITNWFSINFAAKLQISFAWILVLAALIYYFFIDIKLAAVAALFYVILTLILSFIAGPTPGGSKILFALVMLGGGFGLLYYNFSQQKAKLGPNDKVTNYLPQLALVPLFLVYDLLELTGLKSTLFKE